MTETVCGADISSTKIDAALADRSAALSVARTPEGVAELARFCRTHRVGLVVMEATGGYEKLPFALLWAEGLPCAVVNPRFVRRFAEALGVLEKTDAIDPWVIARFAIAAAVAPQEPARPEQTRLRELVARLRQLVEMRVAESNRRRLIETAEAAASVDALLALLRREERRIEDLVAERLDADPLWRALKTAMREIKGVAGRTVARLLAELPEIGTISGKAVAKLAGLAPIARESGASVGRRRVRGGRRSVRDILFVVAEVVRRHEPDFTAFAAKLAEAGKPKKAIRVALARKLLVRLNAKARDARNARNPA